MGRCCLEYRFPVANLFYKSISHLWNVWTKILIQRKKCLIWICFIMCCIFSESLTVWVQFQSNNISQISVIHNKFCQLSWGYQVLTEERKIYKLLEKSGVGVWKCCPSWKYLTDLGFQMVNRKSWRQRKIKIINNNKK